MPTGPGASRAFAVASSICKKRGYSNFKAGSPGANCRGQMAEKVYPVKGRRKSKGGR